jgi:hypothetical protein
LKKEAENSFHPWTFGYRIHRWNGFEIRASHACGNINAGPHSFDLTTLDETPERRISGFSFLG